MTTSQDYEFRRMTYDDLPMLMRWRAQPHVLEWWDAPELDDQNEPDDPRVTRCIVSFRQQPFGYIQDYDVHGWEGHHFADLPRHARGIDQFIGEPDMIGKGHGTRFISVRMKALFGGGAPVIATDPHPDNARAIAVYRKLGFQPAGEPQDTQWGRILPMLARPRV